MRALPLVFALAPLVAGCNPLGVFSVYRMEIQQGNYLTQEMVSQLQSGMTRDQVRFVLGTPLLVDIFHDNRWDYVYRRGRAGSREIEERRLSVFFENDRLVRVEGDVTTGLEKSVAPAAPVAGQAPPALAAEQKPPAPAAEQTPPAPAAGQTPPAPAAEQTPPAPAAEQKQAEQKQ